MAAFPALLYSAPILIDVDALPPSTDRVAGPQPHALVCIQSNMLRLSSGDALPSSVFRGFETTFSHPIKAISIFRAVWEQKRAADAQSNPDNRIHPQKQLEIPAARILAPRWVVARSW